MLRSFAVACASLALALALPCAASAKGVMRVQQADGSVQTYKNITIKVVGRTLRMTTADNKGTLVVSEAACSMVDNLLRCLPYQLKLEQKGTHLLDFDRGTVYYNPTQTKQQLKHSSTQLEPDGVLASFRSHRGTYVNVSGTLDGRAP